MSDGAVGPMSSCEKGVGATHASPGIDNTGARQCLAPTKSEETYRLSEIASASAHWLSRPLVMIAAGLGMLLAGTLALWAHYGSAVFYETILAGIAACL